MVFSGFFREFEPTHLFFVDKCGQFCVALRFLGYVGYGLTAVEQCVERIFFGIQSLQFSLQLFKFLPFLECQFGRAFPCRLWFCVSIVSAFGSSFSLLGFLFRILLLLPLAVVGIVARKIFYRSVAGKHEKVVHDIVEEITVVAHYDHAPFEVGQIFLKYTEGYNVKVVGGLVEYQEVG